MGIKAKADAKIKGASIKGYYKFIKKKWGPETLAECVKATGIDPGQLQDQMFYPVTHSTAVIDWIAKEKGVERLRECGRFTVQNIGAVAYLVCFMNLETLVQKMPANQRQICNYGEVGVELDKPNKTAVVHMKDTAYSPNACYVWWGVFEGMLEMTDTEGNVENPVCQHKGAAECKYIIKWK